MSGLTDSAVANTERSLARIEALDAELRSCVLVRREAIAEAADLDRSARSGPLTGWTVAVKDNMDVAGTVRSDGLGPPHPPTARSDSLAVARLRAAGAVIVAKANLEQLSFGATTQNPAWGACRNPWDRNRIPGGSSGGSAVAVGAGLVDAALGTDTGGSLRNPASFCGIAALRPSHGLIPMDGVTPLSPSMDVVGPMARSAADLHRLLEALIGLPRPAPIDSIAGLRVGIPRTHFLEELDPDVAASFDQVIPVLAGLGASIESVTLAGADDVPAAMSILQNAEAADSLRDWWDDPRLADGIRERLELGRDATPAALADAARTADAWRQTVSEAFREVAVILTPATPFVAPPISGENLVALSRRINRCTGLWSLIGGPALVLPLPPATAGLPVGAQLIGPSGSDRLLLTLGESIQAVTDWHERVPVL